MFYWLAFKIQNGKFYYVYNIDEYGYPRHTEDETQAMKIHNFDTAMRYVALGYSLTKH